MNNELIHHGILGMKWGIRRYQNPDGSLTPEGRKRYGSVEKLKSSKEYLKIMEKDRQAVMQKYYSRNKNTHHHALDAAKKVEEEFLSTKEYKDMHEVNEKHPVIEIRDRRGNVVDRKRSYYDAPTAEETVENIVRDMNIESKFYEKYRAIGEKYASEIYDAFLKDIQAEDTQLAREYIRDLIDVPLRELYAEYA